MVINNEAGMDLEAVKILEKLYNTVLGESSELNLSGFKGIKIIFDSSLPPISDGRLEDKILLLPRNKIQRYLHLGNYDIIKSTIHHELCHVDLANKLPFLHELLNDYMKEENYIKGFTIMIYIEYVVHLKSKKFETFENKIVFFESVNNKKWNFNNDVDKVMFIKVSPYILGRDTDSNYLKSVINIELKNRLLEIKKEFEKLPTIALIDNYRLLEGLERLVSEYVSND